MLRRYSPGEHGAVRPLTTAQRGVYFAHLLDESGVAYNTAHYRDIHGALDPELLSKAVDAALSGVPTYCVKIELNDEIPYARECGYGPKALVQLDVSQDSDPLEAALRWMERERNLPFALEDGPLFRLTLIKLGPTQHFLFHCYHHIIVDGAGIYQLERWIFEGYNCLKVSNAVASPCNQSDALDVEGRYRDSASFADDKKYWLETKPTEVLWSDKQLGCLMHLFKKSRVFVLGIELRYSAL